MLSGFPAFCARLQIPSRDRGLVPFAPMWGSQRYLLGEIEAGLRAGIHEFVIVKGRQLGVTTLCDALDLWYLQSYSGLTGMLVSDDDDNRDYRRDVLLQMLASLPRSHRWPVRLNNRGQLAWAAPNRSRLLFAAAGTRLGSNLGRSRGLNFLHGDEVGTWPDAQVVAALRAALSTKHPARLYLWNSTARGFNVFHEMWKVAQTAVTQRAIFVGWWRHEGYRIEQAARALWEAYGVAAPSPDEWLWMRAIEERYDVEIELEQLAWYRWQLAEEFVGDASLLAQEFPCLPEDAFQAFGEKFIAPALIQRLRLALPAAGAAAGYRYEWGAALDESRVVAAEPGATTLRVWEEPVPEAVYVLSAHPSWSSSPHAPQFVCQVWRAWPDRLEQVAEYATEHGAMYQFAWVIGHLAGAYRTFVPVYLILEIGTTGLHVLNELQRLEQYGYGLSLPARRREIIDLVGSMRQYLFRRPDTLLSRPLLQWKTSPQNRPWLLHGVRDELERGHVTVRSAELLDELSWLRQGEGGDHDEIAAGGTMRDDRAIAAALAVEAWLKMAMPDLLEWISPKEPDRLSPKSAEHRLVSNFLNGLTRKGL